MNDDVKVNKTQRISAKIDLELDSLPEFLCNQFRIMASKQLKHKQSEHT